MRDNNFAKFMKGKSVIAALVICLAAVAVMTGIYTVRNSRQSEDSDYIDLSELQGNDTIVEEEQSLAEAATDNVSNTNEEEEKVKETTKKEEVPQGSDTEEASSGQVDGTITHAINLDFKEEDSLNWPIDGNVIMNYSMDQTTYFSTLDVYKYNPAVVISADVNGKVTSAANGKVTDITVNEETGNTITFDLGNGYEAIYGQLKEIPLQVGDVVETNEVIGYVSEPTKYYSVEGSNLYFQLLKDGEPVNPMNFFE